MTCDHSANVGFHKCLTHDETFPNNLQANEHGTSYARTWKREKEGACEWVWLCLDCGEDVPNG
jgi:hypothetical protein